MAIEDSLPLPAPWWDELILPAPEDPTGWPFTANFNWADDFALIGRGGLPRQADWSAPGFGLSGTGLPNNTELLRHPDVGLPMILMKGGVDLLPYRHPWVVHADRAGGPIVEPFPRNRVMIVDLVYAATSLPPFLSRNGFAFYPVPGTNSLNNDWPSDPSSQGGLGIKLSLGGVVATWYDTGGSLIDQRVLPGASGIWPDPVAIRIEYVSGLPGQDATVRIINLRDGLPFASWTFDGGAPPFSLPRYLSRGGVASHEQAWGIAFGKDNDASNQVMSARVRWGPFLADGTPIGGP